MDKERFDMKVLMESKRITKVDERLITEIGELSESAVHRQTTTRMSTQEQLLGNEP